MRTVWQVYPEDEVVKAQLSMLSRAKLVDFEIEKHKLLHKSDEVPPGKCRRLFSFTIKRYTLNRAPVDLEPYNPT